MAPQILTFIIVLAVIFIIFKIFNLSIKIFFKLLINALIGAALLFVFNFVFAGLMNLSFFYINITNNKISLIFKLFDFIRNITIFHFLYSQLHLYAYYMYW